jgi:hypothetical protein
MGTLDRWNRGIFAYSPFVRQISFFSGMSREDLEEQMVGLCAVNPLALRLVVGLGFRASFLSQRRVWEWLQRPQALHRRRARRLTWW